MKPCGRCGETKPLTDFYRRSASPDGLNYNCKNCDLQDKADLREHFKSRSDEEIEALAVARGPRACRKCNEVKDPDLFPRDRGRRDGRGTMCLVCAAATTMRYRTVVSPEVYKARKKAEFGRNRENYRNARLKKCFGITRDDYLAMRSAQNDVCAICGEPETRVNPNTGEVFDLSVDHDHLTNIVRELLCSHCNKGLGQFNDSPILLARAARYIAKHRALQAQAKAT